MIRSLLMLNIQCLWNHEFYISRCLKSFFTTNVICSAAAMDSTTTNYIAFVRQLNISGLILISGDIRASHTKLILY